MDEQEGTLDELRTWSLERALPQEQIEVWDAITDHEEMRQWSPVEVVGTRSLGAPVTVARRDAAEPASGRIVAFERPRLFSYAAGGRTRSWEVLPNDDQGGCTLRFLSTVDADAPAPADHAEWDRARAGLARELDALEAYVTREHSVNGTTSPYLAGRGV